MLQHKIRFSVKKLDDICSHVNLLTYKIFIQFHTCLLYLPFILGLEKPVSIIINTFVETSCGLSRVQKQIIKIMTNFLSHQLTIPPKRYFVVEIHLLAVVSMLALTASFRPVNPGISFYLEPDSYKQSNPKQTIRLHVIIALETCYGTFHLQSTFLKVRTVYTYIRLSVCLRAFRLKLIFVVVKY